MSVSLIRPLLLVAVTLLLALAVTGRADDAVASPGETRDSLEQAAADARFPREERHAAAGRIAQHYAGQGPEVRR